MDELLTPRLSLRPVGLDDLPPLHSHWTEPEVRRFLWDGRTLSIEEVRRHIRTSDRLFREYGVGLWAVRPAGSSELAGCAGFWFFHEPPELELILSISPSFWGQGLARECAGALFDHAFNRLGWPAVQASADAPNTRSLRLMRRLGMGPSGERPGEFGTIQVFTIARDEWRARPGGGPAPASG